MSKPLWVLIAALTAVAGAQAETKVYRWVDENGVVNYSHRKPADDSAEVQVLKGDRSPNPEAVEQAAAAQASGDDDEAGEDDGQLTIPELRRRIAANKQADCDKGRRLVETIEPRARVRVEEADGSIRVLSDEEREERLAQGRQMIADNC